MRCISPESTASVTLVLTIPQIPPIDFSFLLSAFDDDAVVPEGHLDVRDRFAALEYRLARMPEGVGIDRKYSPELALVHPHPKQFAAHEAVIELQVSVFERHDNDVVVIVISNCSCHRTRCFGFQPPRLDRLSTGHKERHHGYGHVAVNGCLQHGAFAALAVNPGRPALGRIVLSADNLSPNRFRTV